jgi:hypothetical protein
MGQQDIGSSCRSLVDRSSVYPGVEAARFQCLQPYHMVTEYSRVTECKSDWLHCRVDLEMTHEGAIILC